jgi:hypothetical protein
MSPEVTEGVVAFVLAFIAGWVAVRLAGLVIGVHKTFKAERARRARLEYFARRWPIEKE